MKYYILDLSPHNSMVKYLVDNGHTVFVISWKNPTAAERYLGLDDYVNLGIMDALSQINSIIPNQGIHTAGYCIGGTLLMIAAAAMAKINDNRIKSITLFAAQVDFKDAGELLLFIDESQVEFVENLMADKGYLEGEQMAGAFSMLHSVDLIWSRYVEEYLLGKPQRLNDLMAWDTDTTRLPYKMHSEYLRKLFLKNELSQGHFKLNGRNIALEDINVPIYVVSTIKDHVSPWKSVYKIHDFTKTDITFVLTNGGHNSGIVDEPGHQGRNFQILEHKKSAISQTPEVWMDEAPNYDGSWWLSWNKWLSAGDMGELPLLDNNSVLCDAPGTYVLEN